MMTSKQASFLGRDDYLQERKRVERCPIRFAQFTEKIVVFCQHPCNREAISKAIPHDGMTVSAAVHRPRSASPMADASIQLRAAVRPANHRRVLLLARAPNGAFSAEVGGVNSVHENSGGRDDHWTAPNSGLTELGVNTLAFDPRDPTAVYAGTSGGDIFVISFAQ